MADFPFSIPTIDGGNEQFLLNPDKPAIFVGANGAGKSSLIHLLNNTHHNTKRISATRQLYFQSEPGEVGRAQLVQFESQIDNFERQLASRVREMSAEQKAQITIGKLILAHDALARKVADAYLSKDKECLEKIGHPETPIALLNRIFQQANLDISFLYQDDGSLRASKGGSTPYSVSDLSDGERAALFFLADVLTAKQYALIIVDEPERHMHRSISAPLVKSVMSIRDDCTFVLSTHDLELAGSFPSASSILVRSYDKTANRWEISSTEGPFEVDDSVFEAVLGARKRLVFVEGAAISLDLQLFSTLFPNYSFRSAGSCNEVERIVKGLNRSDDFHWLQAYGIIDSDHRSDSEVEKLAGNSIFAIPHHSIESIYYHPKTISLVADRFCPIINRDPVFSSNKGKEAALELLRHTREKQIKRKVSSLVRQAAMKTSTNDYDVDADGIDPIEIDRTQLLVEVRTDFDAIFDSGDYETMIAKFPIKSKGARNALSQCLGFGNYGDYEEAVRSYATMDADFSAEIILLLGLAGVQLGDASDN